MTARERLDWMRATWWAGPPPESFILDRHGKPLGVLCMPLPETHTRWRLLCRQDPLAITGTVVFASYFEEVLLSLMPTVELERVRSAPLFCRLIGESDGGRVEDVEDFWPLLEPLPSFSFIAALYRSSVGYRAYEALRRVARETVVGRTA